MRGSDHALPARYSCAGSGQVITQAITQYLISMLRSQKHIEVHGIVFDGYLPCLRLLTNAEEETLKQLDK